MTYGTTKLNGAAECNCDGNFEKKQEFDDYAKALAGLKAFLNIKE